MTDSEWLECDVPGDALRRLDPRPSRRKVLLFCAACAARMLIVSFYKAAAMQSRIRAFVALLERYADGLETWEMVSRAGDSVETEWAYLKLWCLRDGTYVGSNAGLCECTAAEGASSESYHLHRGPVLENVREAWRELERSARRTERSAQMRMLLDILGNPFRPVAIDSACLTWHDGTIVKLAQTAYDERALASGELDRTNLAVLADALEEAGCANVDIPEHLRSPGPHVRGCWVVDLVLAKE